MPRRKEKWPRAMIQKIDQLSRAANVAAHRADCLAECADLNLHAAVASKMVHCPAAVAAQHAGSVRVIQHHNAVEFLSEAAELRQGRDIAIHGKNTVRDEQLMAGPVFRFLAEPLAI